MFDLFGINYKSGVWYQPTTNEILVLEFDRTGLSATTRNKPNKSILKRIVLFGAEVSGLIYIGEFK